MSTVDLLVVYNSQVARAYGTALNATVQNAMDRLNKALRDSLTNVQVRLVKVQQVPDGDIAAIGTQNITNVQRSRQVAQLRDQYGADLVQAWGVYPSVCGQGYQQTGRGLPAQYGFSIINAATSRGTKVTQCTAGVAPAHEVGHNMGGGHDRITDRAAGRQGDAFGYIDQPHRFMDLMSYQSSCRTCAYAWLFSNPDVKFNGFPIGKAGTENNARNIRLYGPVVANYRPARV